MQKDANIFQEMSELFLRVFCGKSDERMRERLRRLENRYHLSPLSKEEFVGRLREREPFDAERAYRQFDRLCGHRKDAGRFRRSWGVAAGVVLLICGGALLRYGGPGQSPKGMTEKISLSPAVILADGSSVPLSDFTSMREKDGSMIALDSGRLVYTSPSMEREVLYNTLVVPRGSEFRLSLSDGTNVWLNAGSELRYPVTFAGDSREVWLVGEAYFEVISDSTQPFVVHSSKGKIEVLGTSFNVRNYPEESRMVTTLVRGRVAYTDPERRKYDLFPGDQAISQPGQETILQSVNPEYYVGWKDGEYIFKSATLEEIMQELSRWYNITVFYANSDVKQFHFTGELKRYEHVESFLRFLEIGGDVRFEVRDHTVTVRRK